MNSILERVEQEGCDVQIFLSVKIFQGGRDLRDASRMSEGALASFCQYDDHSHNARRNQDKSIRYERTDYR